MIGTQSNIAQSGGTIGVGAMLISTSSIATGTTRSIISSFGSRNNISLDPYNGTNTLVTHNSTTTALIKNGEGIMFGIRAPSQRCQGTFFATIVSAGSCESATSSISTTSPGYIRWAVKYHYYR